MRYYEINPKQEVKLNQAEFKYDVVWTGNGMFVAENHIGTGVTVSSIVADENLIPHMTKSFAEPGEAAGVKVMDYVELGAYGERYIPS